MSGICSVHSPKTTDPDCAACNAVTDTGPTVERRWTIREDLSVLMTPEYEWTWLVMPHSLPMRDRILATLNEAEDLRAERDALTERVRVLEARLEKATAVIKALEATQLVAGVLSRAYDEWRGLAGAEPPGAGEMLGAALGVGE